MGSKKEEQKLHRAETFLHRIEKLENGFVVTMICEGYAPETMSGRVLLARKRFFVFSEQECNDKFVGFVCEYVGKELPKISEYWG